VAGSEGISRVGGRSVLWWHARVKSAHDVCVNRRGLVGGGICHGVVDLDDEEPRRCCIGWRDFKGVSVSRGSFRVSVGTGCWQPPEVNFVCAWIKRMCQGPIGVGLVTQCICRIDVATIFTV
jgi:hypothetical protein